MKKGKRSQPWLRFYTADWRGDAELRAVGYAARGLWIDMISLMHEATPYGHLVANNGRALDADGLASRLGGKASEVQSLLDKLEREGVFSRTDDGVIFSRRMVSDALKAQRDRENGTLGGNPKLNGSDNGGGPEGDKEGVNPPVKPRVKAHARANQKPESSPIGEESAASSDSVNPRGNIRRLHPPFDADESLKWRHVADKIEADGRPSIRGHYIQAVVDAVKDAARIDEVTWRGNFAPLIAWLKEGIDPDRVILPAIREAAKRQNYPKPCPGSLLWFEPMIRERRTAA